MALIHVIVFDVAASQTGALTVLKDFYQYVVSRDNSDVRWTIVVSTDCLGKPPEDSGVTVLRIGTVKKSWFHRIAFELFVAARIVTRLRADVILSLQNLALLWTKVPQVVYVHQSLPYAKRRFSYFDPEQTIFAFLADLMRPLIGWSVRRAKVAIVQTEWLKVAMDRKHSLNESKIKVVKQTVQFQAPTTRSQRMNGHFFYPTNALVYKGITDLVEATESLVRRGLTPQVILTISGTENSHAERIGQLIKRRGLSEAIQLVGRLPRDRVLEHYQTAVLVFPSRLESFGLPLLEARLMGTPVIACDLPFAHEVLAGYPQSAFYGPGHIEMLAEAMLGFFNSDLAQMRSDKIQTEPLGNGGHSTWGDVIPFLKASVTRH